MERDPYDGPTMDIDMSVMNLSPGKDMEANGKTPERSGDSIHHRPPTRSGGRNMQESSFAFSGLSCFLYYSARFTGAKVKVKVNVDLYSASS